MRLPPFALAFVLAASAAPGLRAQSLSRDWRPEDRTVIGDFSLITSIATAIDRVYVSSPIAVLIWNPQFHQWQGPYDPPDPQRFWPACSRALVDPLDNSLWLARADGWIHFQPELQLWDQGPVPDGVQTIAFDAQRSRRRACSCARGRGWQLLPRGGLDPVARPRARAAGDARRGWRTCSAATPRCRPTRRRSWSTRGSAWRASPRRRARSTTSAGISGPRGSGCCSCQDGAATARAPAVRPSLAGGRGRVRLARRRLGRDQPHAPRPRRRSRSSIATSRTFARLQGSGRVRACRSRPVRKLAGQGSALWAATDRGLARDRDRRRPGGSAGSRRAACPTRAVYAVVVAAGPDHGGHPPRPGARERFAPGRAASRRASPTPCSRSSPRATRSGSGTQRGLLLALPGRPGRGAAGRLASPSLQAPVVALASLGDTLVALTRDQLLWRDPRTGPGRSAPISAACSAASWRSRRTARGSGWPGERGVAFARLGTPADAPAPARATCPAPRNDLAVDDDYLWVATDARPGALPARRHPAVTPRVRGHRARPRREFDRIRRIAAALGRAATGLGDDCAVLAPADRVLVASTDVSVEGVHFRRDWLSLEEIGWRATAAALSDLAADGAEAGRRPRGAHRAGRRPDERRARRVMAGAGAAAARSGARCSAAISPRARLERRRHRAGLGLARRSPARARARATGSGSPARSAAPAPRSRPGGEARRPTPRRAGPSRTRCRGSQPAAGSRVTARTR